MWLQILSLSVLFSIAFTATIRSSDFRYSFRFNLTDTPDTQYIYYNGNNEWIFHNTNDDTTVKSIECDRIKEGILIAKEPETCADNNFIMLTSKQQNNQDNTTRILNGEWDSVWKTDDRLNYFYRKSQKKWIELDKNKVTHEFKEISSNSDSVIIFAYDRNFYIKLSTTFVWGDSITNLENTMSTGEWINKRRSSVTI